MRLFLPAPLRRLPGLLALGLVACADGPEAEDTDTTPALSAPGPGELLISQLYTTGAVPSGGTDHYYADQLVELVNATDHPLDLSGVRIADVYGAAGEINAGMEPDSYRRRRPNQVVMQTVWRLPEGVQLAPGEVLSIAHDGANHRPFSELDCSSADFEAYAEVSGNDEDHPTVPNLESVVYNGGYDWLMTVFGPSVVVLDAETELGEMSGPYGALPTVPVEAVLDGIDTVMDADSGAFKRLPDAVDGGFAWADGAYSGTALHRVQSGGVWQDTNDAGADFVVGPPTLTRDAVEGEVFGDPWLELGTGEFTYQPLEEGAEIELVAGFQGGWHLDASVWFGGFGPEGVVLSYEAVDLAAERVSFVTQTTLYEAGVLAADEGWHRVGDRVVLDILGPDEVVGEELIVRVTAAMGEQTWSDERRVRVVDEEE